MNRLILVALLACLFSTSTALAQDSFEIHQANLMNAGKVSRLFGIVGRQLLKHPQHEKLGAITKITKYMNFRWAVLANGATEDLTGDDAYCVELKDYEIEIYAPKKSIPEGRAPVVPAPAISQATQPSTPVVHAKELTESLTESLEREIISQKRKVDEAKAESEKYIGGLVKALSESTLAMARQTLAMLEQRYFILKYGLSHPAQPTTQPLESAEKPASSGTQPQQPERTVEKCLEISSFNSSILSSNNTYTELAWKADVKNTCDREFVVRVTFFVYDKDDFELDSDYQVVRVLPSSSANIHGKMLISPPAKAARMAKQGVKLNLAQ